MMNQASIATVLAAGPIVPVVTVDDVGTAVPLAEALLAGGIHVMEITLRTPAALGAMLAIAKADLPIEIGAGTCLGGADIDAAARSGATFAVSPGASESLLVAARQAAIPLLPGAATVSEMMRLAEAGYEYLKLFPAAQVGGVALLRSVQPVLPRLRFVPTGGVTPNDVGDYLAQPNVACVGGSWIAPRELVMTQRFEKITELAVAAIRMSGERMKIME